MRKINLKYEKGPSAELKLCSLSDKKLNICASDLNLSNQPQYLFLYCPFLCDIVCSIAVIDDVPTFIVPDCSVSAIKHLFDLLTHGHTKITVPHNLVASLVSEIEVAAGLFCVDLKNVIISDTKTQDNEIIDKGDESAATISSSGIATSKAVAENTINIAQEHSENIELDEIINTGSSSSQKVVEELQDHDVNSVTSEDENRCKLCKKQFTTRKQARRHLREVHKVGNASKNPLVCKHCKTSYSVSFNQHIYI